MDAEYRVEAAVSIIAGIIGGPARTRMLYCLLDGRARTSTELAIVSGVNPPTASVHLNRLTAAHLVKVLAQGRHRYYSLDGPVVATILEGLSVFAGGSRAKFVPHTPARLRAARTCDDHMAGTVAVSLHDRLHQLGWFRAYELTAAGTRAVAALGIDLEATRSMRRRFAYACLDWSERRPHIGGALGAALLKVALKRKWLTQDLDSRALEFTSHGRREMLSRFDLHVD
jgi:DNA-binding transcriptional ArsR family regulator